MWGWECAVPRKTETEFTTIWAEKVLWEHTRERWMGGASRHDVGLSFTNELFLVNGRKLISGRDQVCKASTGQK